MPAAACMTDDYDDADTIASELELENGGIEMTDEAPQFGDSDLFTSSDVTDATDYADAMTDDPDVAAMRDAPDAVVYDTILLWGQMPGDPNVTDPTNWSGAFSVNRGAIVVLRTIRFDGPRDRVLDRDDRRAVAFTSVTGPHNDGLLVKIIDPAPSTTDPLILTYRQVDGDSYQLPMADLVDGIQSRVVDDLGNRITAGAMRHLVDLCNHGRLRGRWQQVAPHRGRFIGGVSNAVGEPVGHIRGVYGKRLNGDQVFFGKYINREGRFMGIFRGTYGEGHFQGTWVNRAGELGALGGEYRESAAGDRIGGHFLGRWTELTCDVPLPRPPAN